MFPVSETFVHFKVNGYSAYIQSCSIYQFSPPYTDLAYWFPGDEKDKDIGSGLQNSF